MIDKTIIDDKYVLDDIRKLLKKAHYSKDVHNIISRVFKSISEALEKNMDNLPINECQHVEDAELLAAVTVMLLERDLYVHS